MQGFENRLHFSRELAAGVVNSRSKAGSKKGYALCGKRLI
jgi:hypothetical protein